MGNSMRSFPRVLSLLLLLLNGTGAVFGGLNLMTHPDGSGMQMSLTLLEHSPFNDFFLPGVILFAANGLSSFFVLVAMVIGMRNVHWLIAAQGAILGGWIVIQVIMIRTIAILHFVFGGIGLVLIICGWILTSSAVEKQLQAKDRALKPEATDQS